MSKQLKKVSNLNPGDLVRGKTSRQIFHVIAIYGDRATAVQVQDITNPSEWEVLDNPKDKK